MGGEVKSMRALVLAIGVLVIVAGCGRIPGAQISAGDYKLYEAASTSSAQQVSVIDSRSHLVERTIPLGTPSPDWTHLYTVTDHNLVDLDPQTGATFRTLRLPGDFQLPPATSSGVPGGLSQNGRWLVLVSTDMSSSGIPYATHLLVVDTSYAKGIEQVNLNGLFGFDAVSNDGRRIFLIEYLDGNQYHVRFYDLGAGRLDPNIVFDKSDGSSAMAGVRLSGIASHDGQWLYSVYVRSDKSAFIHALNLDVPFALCLDLPGSGYGTNPDEFHWSLAVNAAGTHLYAANGATGMVTDLPIDGGTPGQMRAARLNNSQLGGIFGVMNVEAKELGGNAAAVSPDGRTLVIAGRTGLVWIDTASLKTRDSQLSGWRVSTLAMSPDGATVYAINDAGLIAELTMAGAHSATTFGGAGGQPLALMRVA
jgi:DNA-binding beta-propeller fold protein YncE